MTLNTDNTSVIIGLLSLVAGYLLKGAIDYFVKRRTDKRQLSDKFTLEQVTTLLEYLSTLIETCKIQIQDEQYAFHDDYWKPKGFTSEAIQKSKDGVTERSKEIIKYKEICTRSSYFLPDKGGEVRIKLNEITNIIDVDIINFYSSHIEASDGVNVYIDRLNLLRQDILIMIHDTMK